MTKLHEILAVEDSLNTVFTDAVKESVDTFSNKEHLFKGHQIIVEPLAVDTDGRTDIAPGMEEHDVAETVPSKLEFLLTHFVKAFDVYAQKEKTNQSAKSDLIVNGDVLIKDCPATMLLGLETKLKILRGALLSIKTNNRALGWVAAAQPNVWAARRDEKFITKKVQRERVVIQPTEHQPGQFTTYTEDVQVGKKITTHYSGLIDPQTKSDYIARVDILLRAAKKARQRANQQDVDTKFKVGKVIKNFILSGPASVEDEE